MSRNSMSAEALEAMQSVPVPEGFKAFEPDKIVQIAEAPNGLMALTREGRLFFRTLDSRNFDGRNPVKYVWHLVEGPSL